MDMLFSLPPIYVHDLPDHAALNAALADAYRDLAAGERVTRSHFFEGRYENIYIDRADLPPIESMLQAACHAAAEIHACDVRNLQAGFWFNDMPPGSRTLPHTHDDDDELLSCVYYVTVPGNSGCLVVEASGQRTVVQPQAGRMIFFPPDVLHWVTPNLSGENRLSIGVNVGLSADAADC